MNFQLENSSFNSLDLQLKIFISLCDFSIYYHTIKRKKYILNVNVQKEIVHSLFGFLKFCKHMQYIYIYIYIYIYQFI